jgi:hypothetical protein
MSDEDRGEREGGMMAIGARARERIDHFFVQEYLYTLVSERDIRDIAVRAMQEICESARYFGRECLCSGGTAWVPGTGMFLCRVFREGRHLSIAIDVHVLDDKSGMARVAQGRGP